MEELRATAGAGSRTGGVAALLLAAGYVGIMPIFAAVGAPPAGAEARLVYHAEAGDGWWAIIGLSVATDLLFVPLALALHATLRRANQEAAGVAAAFMLLFVALDLAVTWPAYASLVTLGTEFATAPVDARAGLVAAAGYPDAVLSSPLQAVNSILTLSLGILLAGIAAARAGRGDGDSDGLWRAPAATGIATGLAGIASVAHTALTGELSPLAILATLLTIAWLVATGIGLLRAGRGAPLSRRRRTG